MAKVVGFELNSQDPGKAREFYSNVFNWKIQEPTWGYSSVVTERDDGTEIHGGIAKGPHDFPHGTRIQIEVDDIDHVIETAQKNGAMILREKMEFDDFYLAYMVDPVGIGFGLIERKAK